MLKATSKIILFIMIIIGFSCMPIKAEAVRINDCEREISCEYIDVDRPLADVIEIRYRVHLGKRQYRRWNSTRGKWVDKDWIDIT